MINMKKSFKTFIVLVLTINFANNIFAQTNDVIIQLRQPPQYQFKVEDMWKVTLNNTTQNTYNVYMYGIVTRTGEGKIVDAKTSVFRLQPGTRVIQPKDISPINIIEKNKKYEDAIKFTGELPTGDYEICLTLYNADNDQMLGEECISHSVEIINGIELLFPENNSDIAQGVLPWEDYGGDDDYIIKRKWDYSDGKIYMDTGGEDDWKVIRKWDKGYGDLIKIFDEKDNNENNEQFVNGSFITFSWLAPSPAPRGGSLTYSLTITEIIGRQSAYNAIKSNPAFYKANNLYSTIYQYSSIARNFSSGKRYAWQVTAYLNGIKMTESEVNEFSYQESRLVYKNIPPITKPGGLLTTGIESIRELSLNKGISSSFSEINKSPFQFYGSLNLEGLNSNRQGTGSELPQRYANLMLSPSLAIYNIPFTTNILLSTLGSNRMQNINSFSLGFDPKTLSGMIQDKVEKEIEKAKDMIEQQVKQQSDNMRKELEKEVIGIYADSNITAEQRKKLEENKGKIEQKISSAENKLKTKLETGIAEKTIKNLSKTVKFFTNFNSLGIGTSYPMYTKHTVYGVSSTGLDVEFNPGIFYIALTGLKNQRAIDNVSFKRELYSGRLGIGKKENSHFIFTIMHAKDDENSITVNDTNRTLTPKSNWLAGFDGKLNLLKNKLSFEVEGVLSLYTNDVTAPDIISEAIPGWVKNMFNPKGSSSIDYMYSGKVLFDNAKSNTKISAEIKMIGPGFITLGNPTLRNDKFGFEGKIEQKFLDSKITTSLAIRNYKDNLLNTKTVSTNSTSAIFKLGVRVKSYPSLNLTFMPNFQKNDKQITSTDSSKIDSKTYAFTGMSSYPFRFGGILTQSSLLFSYVDSKTLFGLYDYWTKTSMFTESFTFRIPLSISTSIGMVQTLSGGFDYSRIITFALTGNYMFKDFWQNGAGIDISTEKDKSSRFGIYLNSNIIIAKYITLDIRAENIQYSDNLNSANNYKDFLLRSTISANW